jgi:biotin carboxyl carrier protein
MILEAMKMEIPILAEDAGTVVAVHVAEGDSVASGQPLVEFETA